MGTPIIPALRRLRQEECVVLKVSLCFVVRKGINTNCLFLLPLSAPEFRDA